MKFINSARNLYYLFYIRHQSSLNLYDSNGFIKYGFPGGSVVKNLPANAGDAGDASLIPGLGRSSGEGNSNPL